MVNPIRNEGIASPASIGYRVDIILDIYIYIYIYTVAASFQYIENMGEVLCSGSQRFRYVAVSTAVTIYIYITVLTALR